MRKVLRVSVYAWLCALRLAYADTPLPTLPHAGMGAAPFYSADRTIIIHAPRSQAAYRAPVLGFINKWRSELQRVVHLDLGSARCPLEIRIGGQSNGDTRVLASRARTLSGGLVERIELPDPAAADLTLLARSVTKALLRVWMVENSGNANASLEETLPTWIIDGILRLCEPETLQTEIDCVLLLWSNAHLPPAARLFALSESPAANQSSVATLLTTWLLEKRDGRRIFETILREVASGRKWSAESAARWLANTDDMTAFDQYIDLRMNALTRLVVTPGLTTPGIVQRFRRVLLLYPPYFDNLYTNRHTGYPLGEAAKLGNNPEIREMAWRQALRVRVAAAGRDELLRTVAEAYARFLESLSKGVRAERLEPLLQAAEESHLELENKMAHGSPGSRER